MTINHPSITVHGRAARIECRHTATGTPMIELHVAANPVSRNRQTGEWEQGITTWWRVKAWGELALNVADSLRKGALVTVVGSVRGWETTGPDGAVKRGVEVAADDIAVSLRRARVRIGPSARDQGAAGPGRADAEAPAEQDRAEGAVVGEGAEQVPADAEAPAASVEQDQAAEVPSGAVEEAEAAPAPRRRPAARRKADGEKKTPAPRKKRTSAKSKTAEQEQEEAQ